MTPSTVRLKQLAEAATPGPWEVSGTGQQVLKEADVPYGNQRICETNSMASHYPGKTLCWANLSFIAAANPEAVLGLIARIEKLEAALRFYADHNNWMVTRKDDLHEAKRTIVGDVDSYGYQRDEYSPNILQIIGGKTAREALKEET